MESRQVRWAGVLAGVATLGYYLLFYTLNPRLIFQLGIFWFSMLFPLLAMGYVSWKLRKNTAGEVSWKILLRNAFQVYVLSAIAYHVFYFILFNYIDSDLARIQQEVLMENLQHNRQLLGERNAEALQREMEAGLPTLSAGTAIFSFARSLIGGFMLSLLFAFAFRKE